ncbi:hypothetical protein BC938DRAFT_471980 [Jimgerdemannia flammicorona]|uniref:Uncharacterized protein n=1 Tax=Jimgerdemannia flammicorona TaxID=994334 RepID=A0A433Q6Z1_9FUNG|nr:hypothetical protein BC938DRAFT_471980 [Jimgerdemannia flammicorona]
MKVRRDDSGKPEEEVEIRVARLWVGGYDGWEIVERGGSGGGVEKGENLYCVRFPYLIKALSVSNDQTSPPRSLPTLIPAPDIPSASRRSALEVVKCPITHAHT